MLTTLYVISYLVSHQPYKNKYITRQEAINETIVLSASYPLLIFSPWVFEMERRLEAGWCIVACIALIIIFNISFLVVNVAIDTFRRCKFFFIRRKRVKEYK